MQNEIKELIDNKIQTLFEKPPKKKLTLSLQKNKIKKFYN